MQMNINEYVWVKLTEAGEKVYEKYYRDLGMNPQPLEKTLCGWSKFQMWELMNYFGNQCFNGGQQLFEENILQFTPPGI